MAVAGSQACRGPSIKPQPGRVDASPVRERRYSIDTEWNRWKRIRNLPGTGDANAGLLSSPPSPRESEMHTSAIKAMGGREPTMRNPSVSRGRTRASLHAPTIQIHLPTSELHR
ncbi:hypothetical protein MUK42_12051 [Musa troglodytarum]|uniref:Uncharacterized protein n=1 Tax=Musa troglodytarum TaxID=320322 RepID=A0A9E7GQC6_9LILI|nr:hypothetical protein MUK42_12051 [Musa troglodytarum]